MCARTRLTILGLVFGLASLLTAPTVSAAPFPSNAGSFVLNASSQGSTYAPTFTAIYGEILSPICAGPFCHGANQFLLMTTQEVAYHAMVGVVSHGPKCGDAGLTIVEPGDPDASLLYLKITTPPCGNRMPAKYFPPLDAKQTAQIRDWIARGAMND